MACNTSCLTWRMKIPLLSPRSRVEGHEATTTTTKPSNPPPFNSGLHSDWSVATLGNLSAEKNYKESLGYHEFVILLI